jgi:hypothetical protein
MRQREHSRETWRGTLGQTFYRDHHRNVRANDNRVPLCSHGSRIQQHPHPLQWRSFSPYLHIGRTEVRVDSAHLNQAQLCQLCRILSLSRVQLLGGLLLGVRGEPQRTQPLLR